MTKKVHNFRATGSAAKHIMHVPRSRSEITKQGFVSRISSTHVPKTDSMKHAMCLGHRHYSPSVNRFTEVSSTPRLLSQLGVFVVLL